MKYEGFLSVVVSLSFVVFRMDQKIIRGSVIVLHTLVYTCTATTQWWVYIS